MLRFYFEVARTAYRRQVIYRWANLAGLCTNIFFGIIMSSVMIALYHVRPVTAGYNLRDVLSYIWAAQSLIMVVLPFGWIDYHRYSSFALQARPTKWPRAAWFQ